LGHEGRGSHYLGNAIIAFLMFLCSIIVAKMFNYRKFIDDHVKIQRARYLLSLPEEM